MSGIIERMQTEIDELKREVTELKGGSTFADRVQRGVADAKPAGLTRQQLRDNIIERAKADVEKLVKDARSMFSISGEGNYTYWEMTNKVKFVVNADKRTVVALVYSKKHPKELRERGIAKCHPDECFNATIGRAISLRRALGLTVPSEYLNAPQPTEAQVGDVVRWNPQGNICGKVTFSNSVGVRFDVKGHEWIRTYKHIAIIDDSRER